MILSKKLMTLKANAPSIALEKPVTAKPGTIQEARAKMIPLTTKVKSPRVSIVIGREKKEMIGRNTAFRKPRTSEDSTRFSNP
jgi:hypothetical protein